MPAATRIMPALFVLLWATGFIGARYAMPWSEPFSFLAARFLLAACSSSAGIVLAMGVQMADARRQAMHAVIAGALMHGVYLGGVFWAIHHGMPAGISALIVGLQPLVTALLAGMAAGRTDPRRGNWRVSPLVFVGVVLVLWPKLGVTGARHHHANAVASLIALLGDERRHRLAEAPFGGDPA
jgi:drug/metabolite transporter (DMT)-like permease